MVKDIGNVGFSASAWSKASGLKKRILFTLGVLVVYRLGTYIPVPGINPLAMKDLFSANSSGLLGMFDMFSGGALGRMTIFALNIIPYITASIIMQLFVYMSPTLSELRKEGPSGRRQINQYTRYFTLLICVVQSMAIAVGLESLNNNASAVVMNPGWLFRIVAVFSMTAGTFFVLWMGEKITERGIGNGVSLIIFSGIVSNLPFALSTLFTLGERGTLSALTVVGIIVMVIGVIYGVVYIETAQRRLVVRYPRRQVSNSRSSAGDTSYLPFKVNNAGIIPPIFAGSILLVPTTIATFLGSADSWLSGLVAYLGRGQFIYLLLYAALIAFFAFFYVSIVFNPKETADNLKNQGGIVPGIRPGFETAKHLDFILRRLTVIGSCYLVIVCLLPEILISQINIPFYFGGTSLLIVVTVTIDTVSHIQSHLMSAQYEGIMKKSKLIK